MLFAAIALLAAPTTGSEPVDPDDRVKCRTEEVTGTLSGRRKVCHTVREWRRLTDTAGDNARKIQDAGLLSPSNGR